VTEAVKSHAVPKDFLRTCLLLLLRERQAHGYDLIERAQSLGFDGSDPGGLYRTLRRLEDEGLVHSAWEPSASGPQRRIYEITRAGMEELHLRAKAVAAGQENVAAFLSRYQEFVALGERPERQPAPTTAP
jgi:PadR family transcriptional regulator, regulatory protein PadR